MLKITFFIILALSAVFVLGLFAIACMFVLLYKSSEITYTPVKASDILAREGYTAPPRTRRRKELVYA